MSPFLEHSLSRPKKTVMICAHDIQMPQYPDEKEDSRSMRTAKKATNANHAMPTKSPRPTSRLLLRLLSRPWEYWHRG